MMADKQTAKASTQDQAVGDKQSQENVKAAQAAGDMQAAAEAAKLDETQPGGRYIRMVGKQQWLVNAHGERINEDGSLVKE